MGPYGRGLRLNSKSKGFYIIIAAGTGILPFIDLFHFLLLKTLLWLIQEMAGEEVAKRLNE
jgi:predicted ferric reductase